MRQEICIEKLGYICMINQSRKDNSTLRTTVQQTPVIVNKLLDAKLNYYIFALSNKFEKKLPVVQSPYFLNLMMCFLKKHIQLIFLVAFLTFIVTTQSSELLLPTTFVFLLSTVTTRCIFSSFTNTNFGMESNSSPTRLLSWQHISSSSTKGISPSLSIQNASSMI